MSAERWPAGSGPAAVGSSIGRVTAGTAGGLLGLVGLIAHPAPVLIGWLLAMLLVGPFIATCRHGARPHDGRNHVRAAVTATLVAVGAVAVLSGLIAVLGVAAGLLVALLSGAWLTIRSHSRSPDRRAETFRPSARFKPAAATTAAAGVACSAAVGVGPLHQVSTAALCSAWQRSFWLLNELPSGEPHAEMAELRRAMLDELERRDPDGFARWLGTEPRANSDPGRFLTTDH